MANSLAFAASVRMYRPCSIQRIAANERIRLFRCPSATYLTELERKLLLKVSGEHRAGWRDHVLMSLAFGTGLRQHELLALDVGDVFDDAGRAKRRLVLRVFKRSASDPAVQEVVLPELARAKLQKLRTWKQQENESLAPDAPLFVSRLGRRLSASRSATPSACGRRAPGSTAGCRFMRLAIPRAPTCIGPPRTSRSSSDLLATSRS